MGLVAERDLLQEVQLDIRANAGDQGGGGFGVRGEQVEHGLGVVVEPALTLRELDQFEVIGEPRLGLEQLHQRGAEPFGGVGVGQPRACVLTHEQVQATVFIEDDLRLGLMRATGLQRDGAHEERAEVRFLLIQQCGDVGPRWLPGRRQVADGLATA